MTQEEFREKYKNFEFPKETQELLKKTSQDVKIILQDYESEYNKIQESYGAYFYNNGYIKPYDINDFFYWIAEEYPDENLPFIIEAAKKPSNYKKFHLFKEKLLDDIENHDLNNLEEFDIKKVQAIGLLIRSGIIDYLREKNPKISNNQIAGFFQLISKEQLKQSSINPHLSKENTHYAIKNICDLKELDFILGKYGIHPQSE